jgi:soluble lytic murein transglycosylase-like protein
MAGLTDADNAAILAAHNAYPTVPLGLLQAQAMQESGGNAGAVNSSNPDAIGLFQITSATALQPGYGTTAISPSARTDPATSAMFAAQYDQGLYNADGNNWNSALSQYSGGGYTLDSLASKYPQYAGGIVAAGTPSTATGGTPVSGAASAPAPAAAAPGLLGSIWLMVEKVLVVFLGIALVIVALFALFFQSQFENVHMSDLKDFAALGA